MRTHQQRVDKILAKALDDVSSDRITMRKYREIVDNVNKLAARDLTAKERDEVFAEAGGKCEYCRGKYATVIDHVISVYQGGTSDRENLKAACQPCNLDKLDISLDEWREIRIAEGRAWPPDWWAEIREDMERALPGDPRNRLLSGLPSRHTDPPAAV